MEDTRVGRSNSRKQCLIVASEKTLKKSTRFVGLRGCTLIWERKVASELALLLYFANFACRG